MDSRWARAWFAATAACVVAGVIIGLVLSWQNHAFQLIETVFRVFRLIGLVAITVTGIVFHVALSGLFDLESWALASDKLLHLVVPVMAVVGWLAFGPRGLTSARVAKLTVIFPVCYMIFTIIRGPLTSDWYPYPFADVKALGYPRVIINGVWIGLLFVALAAAATVLDKRLHTSSRGA